MKKIGDIFTELGFNKDAPEETQVAFLKHLVAEAQRQNFKRGREIKKRMEEAIVVDSGPKEEQLSFNLDASTECNDKKVC